MTDVLVFLKRIRRERHELKVVQETAAELRAMLLPSAIRYDKDRVQTSPVDIMPERIAEIAELSNQQDAHIRRLQSDIQQADELINSLEVAEYRELLRYRYLSGGLKPMTWMKIAEAMGYSEDHVRGKLHGKAIAEARKVWKRTHGNTK